MTPEPEKALIQSLLNDGDLSAVLAIVPDSSYFLGAGERACFEAIIAETSKGHPADATIVARSLNMDDMVQRMAWVDAMGTDHPGDHAPHYADLIADAYEQREASQALNRLVDSGATVEEIQSEAQRLAGIRPKSTTTLFTAREATRQAIERMEAKFRARQEGVVYHGIPYGISKLDEYTGGMTAGQLIIIGARPSVGKTSVGITMVDAAAVAGGKNTLFVSLEMTAEQDANRLISAHSGVPYAEIDHGELTKGNIPKITQAQQRLAESKLIFQTRPGLTIPELIMDVRKMAKEGLELVVIDYLGLLRYPQFSSSESSYKEVTEISKALKELALSAEIPIVALCQLNRGSAKANRAPSMSDLRDSGSIEQDADVIILLHRSPKQKEEWSQNDIEPAMAILEKNRNGRTGTVLMKFHKPTMTFSPWDRDDFPDEFD